MLSPLPPLKKSKCFAKTSKKILKNRNWTYAVARYFTRKLRVGLKHLVHDCTYKLEGAEETGSEEVREIQDKDEKTINVIDTGMNIAVD